MIMKISNVTVKGKITIPKEIRDILGIHPGDRVYFESSKDGIIIKKAYNKKISDILLSAKPFNNDVNEAIKNIRDEWH